VPKNLFFLQSEMTMKAELARKDLEISKESQKLAMVEKRAKAAHLELQASLKSNAEQDTAAAKRQVPLLYILGLLSHYSPQ
jgi:hypothetical protein